MIFISINMLFYISYQGIASSLQRRAYIHRLTRPSSAEHFDAIHTVTGTILIQQMQPAQAKKEKDSVKEIKGGYLQTLLESKNKA